MDTTTTKDVKDMDTRTYSLRDSEGSETEIEAESMSHAKVLAREWVEDGDWNCVDKTFWVTVEISDEGEEESCSITVAIDPPEPDCLRDCEHDWQSPYEIVGGIESNPGVWGNGGGVIVHEVCMYCHMLKRTDTWAQDPSTGRQGLTSIKYDAERYSDSFSSEDEE
jgi:hypothetical protein